MARFPTTVETPRGTKKAIGATAYTNRTNRWLKPRGIEPWFPRYNARKVKRPHTVDIDYQGPETVEKQYLPPAQPGLDFNDFSGGFTYNPYAILPNAAYPLIFPQESTVQSVEDHNQPQSQGGQTTTALDMANADDFIGPSGISHDTRYSLFDSEESVYIDETQAPLQETWPLLDISPALRVIDPLLGDVVNW